MKIFYTREEVAKHNHDKDLWIIIHNGIYDVTKFLKEHPGGEEVLLNLAGSDATECFDAIGHSTEATQLREMYKVGDLSDGQGLENPSQGSIGKITPSTQSNANQEEEPWDYVEHEPKKSPWIVIFLGIAAVIYAIIFSYIL